MDFIGVPGYKELYGDTESKYDVMLADIPSSEVITMALKLNSELLSLEGIDSVQRRLLWAFTGHLPLAEANALGQRLLQFQRRLEPNVKGLIFSRQHLIAWIVKELNGFRGFKVDHLSKEKEYKMFKAYLLLVDELNDTREKAGKKLRAEHNKIYDKYSVLWAESISQLELAEEANIAFEIYKVECLTRYLKERYRPYLSEFLKSRGLHSVGQWIGSIHQVSNPFVPDNQAGFLKRSRPVKPEKGIDDAFLKQLTLDVTLTTKPITFLNVKKNPLFYHNSEYWVMDTEFYNQAYYRGIYFNLFYGTSLASDFLKRKRDFSHYTGEMSTQVLERTCFSTIITKFKTLDHQILYFDDDNKSMNPDAYYRSNRVMFLFECKGYLFPERLLLNNDYSLLKKHIQEKFIKSDEQGKGISQIFSQIKRLKSGEYSRDKEFAIKLRNKKITIYPIICHDEVNYHMLGLNEFLESEFRKMVSSEEDTGYLIKPLTIINMKTFFELASRKCSMKDLGDLVDRYHRIIKDRLKKHPKEFNKDYYNAHSGFDEMYYKIFKPDLIVQKPVTNGKMWTEAIGLTKEELNEPV